MTRGWLLLPNFPGVSRSNEGPQDEEGTRLINARLFTRRAEHFSDTDSKNQKERNGRRDAGLAADLKGKESWGCRQRCVHRTRDGEGGSLAGAITG